MKFALLSLLFLLTFAPLPAQADSSSADGVAAVRACIMKNDVDYCHANLTPESWPLFDRFSSYKLMPCLPTDFNYASEDFVQGHVMAKATMPAGGGKDYVVRFMFISTPQGLKLDLPATLRRGLGENWENKLQMSEQLYLMMKQNMGDKLSCDMLSGLIKPK